MNHFGYSDLRGKSVVIVGGFGLIGKELSKSFIRVGSNLVIADIIKDELFLEILKSKSESPINYFKFDITDQDDINGLINFVLKKNKRIDVLVNCSYPRTKDWAMNVEDVPFTSVKENLINHLGGYYNITQKVAKQMKKQKSGNIINFSSIYGSVSPTFSIYENTGMNSPPAYSPIKGGIDSLTRYFAGYYGGYNVRVNCISPGGVYDAKQNKKFVKAYKRLTPLNRMAEPKDIIGPVLFLASNDSSYITGQNLIVDGGWTIH